ncbi:MAG: primosomal protein N' [Oscillatoriaceae cyanobacterium]
MQYDIAYDLPLFSGQLVAEPGGRYDDFPLVATTPRWLEVLVDIAEGEQKLYTYRVPPGLDVHLGDVLTVPFGAQLLGAIAVRFTEVLPAGLPPEKVRDVDDVVVAGFFSPSYWQLLERVAEYYRTPLMQVIKTAMPPGLLARSQRRIRLLHIPPGAEVFLSGPARQLLSLLQNSKTQDYSWQYLRREVGTTANRGLKELLKRRWVESYLEQPKSLGPKLRQAVIITGDSFADLTERQREVLEILRRHGGEMWVTELCELAKTSSGVVKKLAEKGCVVIDEQEQLRIPADAAVSNTWNTAPPAQLTPAQSRALATINSLNCFARVLLHGVTGSGKTEVYIQAITPLLAQGKSAIVLVPEIGLTPQLTDRFRARFGDKVAIYHSALSDGERYDSWRLMLADAPQVVIGTRSAIFSPLPNLGIVILDEEFDDSYKQDQPAPTYHARTVASWRAELANCPLILGSATPSAESWAEFVEYPKGCRGDSRITPTPETHYLSLPERIGGRQMPRVEVVDMRQELHKGNRTIFSQSLQDALLAMHGRKQQGILFIHRRGHSSFLSCRSCGYVVECPHCDVSLSYHKIGENGTEFLRCHYCGYRQLPVTRCPECNSPYFKPFGSGTQKVVEQLAKYFPQLRVLRFDSDTTRTKGAHRDLLSQFATGDADVLVGTQMLTKGLDLPQVTLVGVVAADGLLNLSDYRASERAFQILMQVVGRAGRGDEPGRAIIQSYTPEHPVIAAVQKQDYGEFMAMELEQRAALSYPPLGRLVLLRLMGADGGLVEETAMGLGEFLADKIGDGELLGPAPAPIMRVGDRFRWQILLKFPQGTPVQFPSLEQLRAQCPFQVSLAVDIDPLSL